MKVLGIESSCDETGVALYDTEQGLLAQQLYSQIALHAEYGGVVPELASRDHIRKCLPLIKACLAEANVDFSEVDGIAYTAGPGLLGALLVGAGIAKSLALSLGISALGVHHMEGHLLACMLAPEKPSYPFVALLVSGGHTQLIDVARPGVYTLLGETIDDAVGEAFDKSAKLMGLGYPGGAVLAKLAEQGRPGHFQFARPMVDRPGLDFSFSGLKTQVLNTWQQSDQSEQTKADIAYAFEQAVVETLLIKCRRALQQTGYTQLVVAGGVSANQTLRRLLKAVALKESWQVFYPPLAYCTDNGAMIAYAGALRLEAGQRDRSNAIDVRARWPLADLLPIGA